jgi:hypothetical protein
MTPTGRFFLSLPLLLAVAAGCSTAPTPGKVSGKITYKGEVVPAGSVTFHRRGTEDSPGSGIFSYSLRDGVYAGTDLPPGEMVVTVETESANPGGYAKTAYGKAGDPNKKGGDPNDYVAKMKEMGKIPEGALNEGRYVKIPPKYASMDTTPLKVTLTDGKNEFNFELTDD